MRHSPDTRIAWVILAFAASRLAMLSLPPFASDAPVYFAAARQWADGLMPYRDVPFEYPPLAALICYLPMLFKPQNVAAYRGWFAAEMALLDLATFLLVLRIGRARSLGTSPAWIYLVLTALMQPLLFDRFDIAVGLSLLLALGNPAHTSLVVGALVKFVPILMSPLLLLRPGLALRARVRELLLGAVVPLASLLLGAWLWLGASLLGPIAYHTSRGIQIESVWASVAFVGQIFGSGMTIDNSHHAQHLTGGWADALLPFTGPANALMVSAVTAFVVGAWHRHRASFDLSSLATGFASVTLAFLASCRVLSPQFLLWLAPVVPLCLLHSGERRARSLFLVLTATCIALTSYLFRRLLWALAAFHGDVILLCAVRNALLLAMLVLLLRRLWCANHAAPNHAMH